MAAVAVLEHLVGYIRKEAERSDEESQIVETEDGASGGDVSNVVKRIVPDLGATPGARRASEMLLEAFRGLRMAPSLRLDAAEAAIEALALLEPTAGPRFAAAPLLRRRLLAEAFQLVASTSRPRFDDVLNSILVFLAGAIGGSSQLELGRPFR